MPISVERLISDIHDSPTRLVLAVAGGAERQDSVAAGLLAIEGDGLVLVHDAARPLVTRQVIRDVRRAAAGTGAAVPGLACAVGAHVGRLVQ